MDTMHERIFDCISILRRRNRWLTTAWGAARWFVLVLGLLFLACLIDWSIDRWRDTPTWLRLGLFVAQATLWLSAALWLIARPFFHWASDSAIAGWLESWSPKLDHRVITAVELNQVSHERLGMSAELVAQVTREADHAIAACDPIRVLDARKFKWSAYLAGGALVFLAIASFFLPMPILIMRQFLADASIPRHTHLNDVNPAVWPSGEPVDLRFVVATSGDPGSGHVRIDPVGRPAESYVLEREEGGTDSQGTVYVAHVPASLVNFSYGAWLGDGRLDRPGFIRFEPRPTVKRIDAWVELPKYCGQRPDGMPYEHYQPRGDVTGLEGSRVRLLIEVQKLVQTAWIECLADNNVRKRAVPMEIRDGTRMATGFLDLRPDEIAYRIVVTDQNGFVNADPPRRILKIVPDEPPHVVLLPEHFTAFVGQSISADTEVEGKPVPFTARGGKIRIAYQCQDAHGMARAQLTYRILPKDNPDQPGPWKHLPLREIQPGEGVGPFDARQGVFRNSGLDDQIEFYAEPSADPYAIPGRLEGGGRFDFQIGTLGLQVGDQLEYGIEVFDTNPDPQHPPGRSEIRRKRVVTSAELLEWLMQKAEHENRIRELERKQREVPKGRS